jgi:hypothetical protein
MVSEERKKKDKKSAIDTRASLFDQQAGFDKC